MAIEGIQKQPATSSTAIMENFETEVLGMLILMEVDSLAFACGILGLVVPKQKECNLKLLLKYIFRQFNKVQGVVKMEVLLGTKNYTITLSEFMKRENVKQ